MADSMTTVLYVIVLAGWFLLMCVVLRCCSDSDAQSIFDLEEIALSAAGYHNKPTAIVDGQPVRFARVQPLGDSSQAVTGVAATGHREEEMALERLELPNATSALPSAQAVWSPILALRTFVEPLTSRASAAFRNFHISFHDAEEEEGAGGVGVTTTSTLPSDAAAAAAAAAPPSPTSPGGAIADEEQGICSRDGGERRKGWSSPTAADRAEAAATAAPEEIRVASAERFWPPGSGGIELSVVSREHDRAEGGGLGGGGRGRGGGDGERKRVDTAEMVEQDERDDCRVAV